MITLLIAISTMTAPTFPDCSVESILGVLTPGAQYTLTEGDYNGIVWKDPIQLKPTLIQFNQEVAVCEAQLSQLSAAQAANLSVAIDTTALDFNRINALEKYQGLTH